MIAHRSVAQRAIMHMKARKIAWVPKKAIGPDKHEQELEDKTGSART